MDFTFELIQNLRIIFKKIIEETSLEDMNIVPDGFNNNIIWNIAHVIVSEQLLAYNLSGLEMSLPIEMINKYKKGTKPEKKVSKDEINEIKELLLKSLAKTKKDYQTGIFKNYNSYTVSTTGNTLNNIDDALQFIATHEGIHYGYILALLKAVKN